MLISSVKYLITLISLLSLAATTPMFSLPEPNFVIHKAVMQLRDNVQYVQVDADFNFSDAVLDALHNGVAMTIVLEVEIYRKRPYLWDIKVGGREQRFTLEYFDLSEQYIVSNNLANEQHTAMTLHGAVRKLRDIKELAVMDNSLLSDSESYYANTRVRLSLNSLPVPMQLNAFISTEWWLISDWYSQPVVTQQTGAL